MLTSDIWVSLVVAVADNGVIGKDRRLPWRVPSDLRLFRRLTLGRPVIMGRKTFESIGKPLDSRTNIVLTRQHGFAADGTIVAATVDEALDIARRDAHVRGADEIAVIGGAEVFAAMLPAARRIYLTRVAASPPGDTLFPELDRAEWIEVRRETLPRLDTDEFAAELHVLERSARHA